MVINHFGNRNFIQPMRRLQGPSFLVLNFGGGGREKGNFLFNFVPNVFSVYSQDVPIRFLKCS
jgi:hypothetical protein